MLKVENLKVHYPIRGGFFNTIKDYVHAVDGVDIEIEAGKTMVLLERVVVVKQQLVKLF